MKNNDKLTSFIDQAQHIHGGMYGYQCVEFVNTKTKVKIMCEKHGAFYQTPEKHVRSKTRCPSCAGRPILSTDIVICRAQHVHGSRYDYLNTVYVNDRTKITIGCKQHGWFDQLPGHHIHKKQGCPKCKHDLARQRGIGGYSEKTILPTDRGVLYCVRLEGDDSFIKIGITKGSIIRRLTGTGHRIIVLEKVEGLLLDMYRLEQLALKLLNDIRYRIRPMNKYARNGWTECFKLEDEQQVLGIIKTIRQNNYHV